MYPRILRRMRRLVLEEQYVLTVHADDEMNADGLTVYDVERIVLNGRIVERQRNTATPEPKYRIRGRDLDGSAAEVIVKISVTGKLVFITVYTL